MTIHRSMILAALDPPRLRWLLDHIALDRGRRGRRWSRSLQKRILITCAALRTKMTVRELAATFGLSKSSAHRIVSTTTRLLADLHGADTNRRWSWVVDGPLIPTRDHQVAARSKNYRWSCNAQILVRRTFASSQRLQGRRGIETIRFTTEARASKRYAKLTDVCSLTEAIGVCPSFGLRDSAPIESFATPRGEDIADVARVSSMRSPGSRIGGSCVTTVDVDRHCRRRSERSRSSTTSASIYGDNS